MNEIYTSKKSKLAHLLIPTIIFVGLSFLSYSVVNQMGDSIRKGNQILEFLPLVLVIMVFVNLFFSIFIYLLSTSYFDAKKMALEMTESMREAEKKYRLIFESFKNIYLETNTNGVITTITPSVQKLLGYPATELLGKKFDSILALPNQRVKLANALSQGPVKDFEVEIINSNQQRMTFSLDAQPTKDANGNIKITGVLRDITERKIQRYKEWEKNEQLRKLNDILLDREIKMSELKENNRKLTEGQNA